MTFLTRELPRSDIGARVTPRLLVVEDEEPLRRAITRMVEGDYTVVAAADGSQAAELLIRETFDVVLADIGLPGTSGVDLLRLVRAYDLDVPVLLMTGAPTVETAIEALNLGALNYITKPFERSLLEDSLRRATALGRLARAKRDAMAAGDGLLPLAGDKAGLATSFERALDGMWIAYQPIVDTKSSATIGFEALMRTREASMPHPGALLDAAERLGRLDQLGRRVRECAAASFVPLDDATLLFVNLHPSDLVDPELLSPSAPLSKLASRVVLELTERAPIDDIAGARRLAAELRRRGFRIAIDDLGAGYAGMASFANLEPDIVKLDMSLIRSIESSPVRSRVVERLSDLCRELNMKVVAEGIETLGELRRVREIGCDYLQGYLFGKPQRELTRGAAL